MARVGPRRALAVLCAALLSGCATVRVERAITCLSGEDDFEKALMHYVRGEIVEAEADRDEAMVRQLELEIDRIAASIRTDVLARYEGVIDAQAAATAATRTVEAAEEASRALEAADKWAGLISPVTLLETRARLEAARQESVRRAYDVEGASLRLQRAMGVLPAEVLFKQGR